MFFAAIVIFEVEIAMTFCRVYGSFARKS